MRFLGIDYGSKKIGLATADSELKIAVPRPAIYYSDRQKLLEEIKKIVEKEGIGKIVVGLPLSFSFQETTISGEVRGFAEELKKNVAVAIEFENEILSSKEAESERSAILRKIKSRAPQKQVDLDSQAAAIILESYLSRSKSRD